jgi:hypothetical protein
MPVKLGGGGGGGNTPFPTMVFQTSRTWACPMAMEAMVFVIGAGGGGGAGNGNASGTVDNSLTAAQGGGGGGCSVSKLTLAAQNYTIVVGSRGVGGARYNVRGAAAGTAGGNSTFAGSGITTMAGNGGGAGNVGIVHSTNGGTAAAVSGGTATGGTIANNTGGGNAALTTNLYAFSTGGGVGLWEVGEDGVANTANTANIVLQGGGPFRNRALGMTDIPGAEGGTSGVSTLTGDLFNGVQQMVRDQQGNGSGTYRYTNSVNYTGRPVKKYQPSNATHYKYLSGSSPFTGGAGGSHQGSTVYNHSSPGVAGGGGGGACTIQSHSCFSKDGGGGVIIIMPLTVGS